MHPFFHSFLPSIREHSCKTGIPDDSKCILLLDNCNAHSNEFELQSENMFLILDFRRVLNVVNFL